MGVDSKDVHRAGDILDLLFACILEGEVELVANLVAQHEAGADAAGLGERLEAGGDVDPIAENVAILDDDVAEIDAHAKLDPSFRRDVDVADGPFRAAHRPRSAPRRRRWQIRRGARRR
jgi:hypothetical protein